MSVIYRIAGNFRGIQFSRFSRMTVEPRGLNPRNKKSNACAIRTGRGHNCWLAGARDRNNCYFAPACCCWAASTLGTPLLHCFKVSGDTTNLPGARLRAIAPRYIYGARWPCGRGQSNRPSSKIRSRNLCILPLRENWIPRRFPAIRYVNCDSR